MNPFIVFLSLLLHTEHIPIVFRHCSKYITDIGASKNQSLWY